MGGGKGQTVKAESVDCLEILHSCMRMLMMPRKEPPDRRVQVSRDALH